jgi:hypothetical protein
VFSYYFLDKKNKNIRDKKDKIRKNKNKIIFDNNIEDKIIIFILCLIMMNKI